MPKPPRNHNYEKKYTETELRNALESIDKKGLSIRKASKLFNIPRATLQFRKSDKFTKATLGPSPILTEMEENTLVQWLKENAQKGFPRRKEDLQISVKYFLDKIPRKNPFKNNLPNDGWYKAFLKRHPEVAVRTPEGVTSASANVTEKDIKTWFQNIEEYLKSKGYFDILSDPTRVLNGDETCFNLCPKNTRVLAPVGSKNVYEVEHASSKYSITVMFTMSAAGLLTPPMVVFPGKRLRNDIANSIPTDWGIGLTENGWMKADAFQNYVVKILHPSLKKNGIKFPVILFIDGHSSHITLELSDICKNLEIILICLYPNSTRILQPADVAAFKPIKTGWKKALLTWRRENLNETLTKDKFAPILKKVVEEFGKENTIKSGFKATGLYPFNPNAIDYQKCLGRSKEKLMEDNEPKFIDYDTFKRIVGDDKISQFENNTHVTADVSPDTILLYRIWKEFMKNEKNYLNGTMVMSEETLEILDMDETLNKENETEKEIETNKIGAEEEILDLLEKETNNPADRYEIDEGIQEIETSGPEQEQENEIFNIENIPIVFGNTQNINSDSRIIIEEIVVIQNPNLENINENTADVYPKNLNDTLIYAKTPVRKGIKNTEKTSFVITGTEWRATKRMQEEEKLQKELEKEERKKKRLELQTRKKNEMEEKKKRKIESQIKRKNEMKEKRGKKNVNLNRKNQKSLSEIVENKENNQNLKETAEITKINEKLGEKLKIASRNLFQDNENLECVTTVVSTLNENKNLMIEVGLSEESNVIIRTGLCFSCTNNLSTSTFGIKCITCNRAYHLKCIKKYKLHKSNSTLFSCGTCLKNK